MTDKYQIVENLSILYELSLAAGSSLDIKENYEHFIKVLMARKNLSASSYLIKKKIDGKSLYVALGNIPENFAKERLEVSRLNELFVDKPFVAFNLEAPGYSKMESLINYPKGHYLIYKLGDNALLILGRLSHPFEDYEGRQLTKVIQKFGLFMDGLFLREKISEQKEQRKKVEKRLVERKAIFEALIYNSFNGIDIIELNNDKSDINEGVLVIRNEQMSYLINNKEKPLPSPFNLLNVSAEFQPNGRKSEELARSHLDELIKNKHSEYEWQIEHPLGFKVDLQILEQLVIINNKKILIRIYQNITDRKQKEEIINGHINALNQKNEELQKYINSNLQLENFAYIASHDLKAPLRTVSSFAELLSESSHSKLSEKEQRFLKIILNSSNQMQKLVDDLLIYSRINAQAIRLEQIQVKDYLFQIINEIQHEIDDKKAIISVDCGDTEIFADEIKLRQVFQNLITNAIKFQKEDKTPKIEISLSESLYDWRFKISDNGIGIQQKYQDKIFSLFSRLHPYEEFKGTGMGLAICKKIIQQHNGRIWVESNDGGSTFYFTISKSLNLQQKAIKSKLTPSEIAHF
ncbi:MAG: GHKL domain-containing protein [Bacteroidia bacterium]|nr:GHKL domain-containing protein [Bacteroidia bacterium]